MDRPGRIPAARPGARRRPASSRASPTRRRSFPKCIRTPAVPGVRRACSTACSAPPAAGRARADARVRRHLPAGVRDRRAASRRIAIAVGAAAATALFPPIPYFGALVMTEVLDDAAVHALDVAGALGARQDRRVGRFVWLGVLLGADDAEPAGLRAVSVRARRPSASSCCRSFRVRPRPRVAQWASCSRPSPLTMLPWFTYNYVTLGRFTLSPAGGVGRGLWEGSWQATWSGRAPERADPSGRRHRRSGRARSSRRERRRPRAACRPGRCSNTSINGKTSGASGPSRPIRTSARVARVKADQEYRRVGDREHPARRRRRIWPSVSRAACSSCGPARSRFATARSTRCRPSLIRLCWAVQALARARWRSPVSSRSLATRTVGRRVPARRAARLHHRGAFPAADRGAAVAAGAADRAAAGRRSASRMAHRPLTSPRTAGS